MPRGGTIPPGDCSPLVDPDGDGLFGCADPDCFSPRCPEICDDLGDNDADGDIDNLDTDCMSDPEICDNDSDDNGDGLVDCEDPLCATDITCGEMDCDDGVDNDNDSLTDCEDDDCWGIDCHRDARSWVTSGELRMHRAYGIQYNQVDTSDFDCVTQSGSPGTSLPPDEPFAVARFRANNIVGRVRVHIPTSFGSSTVRTCDWSVAEATGMGDESVEGAFQRVGFQITNPGNCRLGTDPETQSWFLPKYFKQTNTDAISWSRQADSAIAEWYRGSTSLYDPAYSPANTYASYLPGYSFSGCPFSKDRHGQQTGSAFLLNYPGSAYNNANTYYIVNP